MGLYTAPLGTQHSTRTPKERAMRLMYLRANRNRYKRPQDLYAIASEAEEQGIDVSGSQTQDSVDYARNTAREDLRMSRALSGLMGNDLKSRLKDSQRRLAASASNKDQQEATSGADPNSAVSKAPSSSLLSDEPKSLVISAMTKLFGEPKAPPAPIGTTPTMFGEEGVGAGLRDVVSPAPDAVADRRARTKKLITTVRKRKPSTDIA